MNDEHAQDVSKRHFLGLPPELRTKIYEYALLEPRPISITATGPQQPPLLRSCTRIREEAIRLHYTNNRFIMTVTDYDVEPILRSYRVWSRYYAPPEGYDDDKGEVYGVIGIDTNGSPNWKNLVEWCKLVHEHQVYGYASSDDGDGTDTSLGAIMDAVLDLRGDGGATWEIVERVLERFKRMLVLLDSRWAN